MERKLFIGLLLVFTSFLKVIAQQLPPVFDKVRNEQTQSEQTIRKYLSPVKILWQTENAQANIINAARLLKLGNGQADLSNKNLCVLKSTDKIKPGILLDFGKELHGGLQLVTGMWGGNKPIKIRIRFGESASETMSNIGGATGATNDHAMRDFITEVPWLGKLEIGNTGFRFVRIDLVDANVELLLKEARAVFIYRDIPYLGSFNSSDEMLNKIWATGAYTVHLNMQDYLWDGIKRDRLVWVGDMHPEVSAIIAVFGYNEVVPKSLDLARDITPLPEWMNGISTYSMWWILIHRDWYTQHGNLAYLKEQRDYLLPLLDLLISKIDGNNSEMLDGTRFLDWPSSENKKGIHAGLQAMLVMSLESGKEISTILGEKAAAEKCEQAVARLRKYVPVPNNSKQGAALMALADLSPATNMNTDVLAKGGAQDYSTFYGYYMLQAKAKAGDYQGAINDIRTFWGAMLNMGATTFWEDFNLAWLPNAGRIDELVPAGKKDIHGDYGAYCYIGHRHSLCHGWAAGPTPWMTEHILGIKVVAAGSKVIQVSPNLGDLRFAEGTFPTPLGILKVKHTRLANGKIKTKIDAPRGIKIVKGRGDKTRKLI